MKHAIAYLPFLPFLLGAEVTVTFGFAYLGSPVTVPLALLCLFTMWLIYRLSQEEPVTRLTEEDMAPPDRLPFEIMDLGTRKVRFYSVADFELDWLVSRSPQSERSRIVTCIKAESSFQEPATGDPVGADPVAGDPFSPAPDQPGGAAGESATEPAGDTGAGEKPVRDGPLDGPVGVSRYMGGSPGTQG